MAGHGVDASRRGARKRAKLSPVGASPGTLVADPNARPPILTVTGIAPEGCETIVGASLADVAAHCERWPLIWLDCAGLADVSLIAEIGGIFGLHALALEDTVNTGQRPKIDFFDDHAFLVLSMIDDAASNRYEQITLYFGTNFVVTFQEREGDPFTPVRKRIEASQSNRLRTRGADYLAYALIDAIVDSYFPVLESAGDKIERLEDEMLGTPQKHQTRQMHDLRRAMLVAKRVLGPLEDTVAALLRSEVSYVSAETKVYFNDTLDHATRLIDTVEMYRDMLTGLLDMHLSLSQAKTSEVINLLTIVSAIFIPLTFLAGIWGMNFELMPELKFAYGYPAALGLMFVVALLLVLYFRWRKWL